LQSAGRSTNIAQMSQLAKRLILFGALLGWCGFLLLVRVAHSGSASFVFLIWNLFLASVPALAAIAFVRADERRSPALVQAAWFALWLMFLPNAPYIVTDFMHLRPRPLVPLWYDVAILASCAGTGLLLAYSSLTDVQGVMARKFSQLTGWVLAAAALVLSGFGIYLGRFLRWNSWDALASPLQLLADVADRLLDPLSHPQTVGVTIVYGVALLLGYAAFRTHAAD
jgi:uncharacterized membrane protein